jgi:hypothetical protein
MKKMRKYLITFIFIILIFPLESIFATVENCETQDWFLLYQCRVENVCKKYKSDKPIFITKNYKEANSNYWLQEAKVDYRENMNNIYSCSMLKSQKKWLELVKSLIPIERSWELKDKIQKDINTKIKKVDLTFKELKCRNIWKNDIYNKLTVLNQTTYELCKYTNYLEYLRDYNSNINNALWINPNDKNNSNKTYSITSVTSKLKDIQDEINSELNHSFKIYPIAYNVYSEYENNYPIHILLELLREDFVTFRDKLYRTINPINQVVYKISNAMSIYK